MFIIKWDWKFAVSGIRPGHLDSPTIKDGGGGENPSLTKKNKTKQKKQTKNKQKNKQKTNKKQNKKNKQTNKQKKNISKNHALQTKQSTQPPSPISISKSSHESWLAVKQQLNLANF